MEKKFPCEQCKLKFRTEKEKRGHLLRKNKVKTPGRPLSCFKCRSCEQAFRNRSLLMRHIRAVHRAVQMPVSAAQELAISPQTSAPLSYSTASCPESGEQTQGSSNVHALVPAETSKSCEVAEVPSSASSSSTQISSSSASQQKLKPIFSSVPCPTDNEYDTTEHGLQTSGDNQNQFHCKCGMQFGNKDTLNAHTRFFLFGKAFHCCISFVRFRDMNSHLREHFNTKPDPNHVACPLCGVIFANKQEYRRHMIMTINDKKQLQGRRCPMQLVEKTQEIAK